MLCSREWGCIIAIWPQFTSTSKMATTTVTTTSISNPGCHNQQINNVGSRSDPSRVDFSEYDLKLPIWIWVVLSWSKKIDLLVRQLRTFTRNLYLNMLLHIMLTGGCFLYKKAGTNNNVQEQENNAFQVVRSSIL